MGAACSCGGAAATEPPATVAPQSGTAGATAAPSTGAATTSTGKGTVVNVAPASTTATVSTVTTKGITISAAVPATGTDTTTATTTPATTTATSTASAGGKAKIAVVYYSTWGHIRALADAVVRGAKEAGADVTLYQIAETLPPEVLTMMHAPDKPSDIPTITPDLLPSFDGIIFGAPTRYGQSSAQYKALWDATGQLWSKGELDGKLAAFFFGTATMGGGQETTASTNMGHFVHHGMIFVPMGYGDPAKPLFNNDVVHGGSPWGPGTLSNGDGSRQVSAMELGMGEYQGKRFATIASAMVKGKALV